MLYFRMAGGFRDPPNRQACLLLRGVSAGARPCDRRNNSHVETDRGLAPHRGLATPVRSSKEYQHNPAARVRSHPGCCPSWPHELQTECRIKMDVGFFCLIPEPVMFHEGPQARPG